MEWGADEELALLDGIKMYGMGNWEDIAEHIGTKTKQQVEDHYLEAYVNTPTCPLPVPPARRARAGPPAAAAYVVGAKDLSVRFEEAQIEEFRAQRKEREAQLRNGAPPVGRPGRARGGADVRRRRLQKKRRAWRSRPSRR